MQENCIKAALLNHRHAINLSSLQIKSYHLKSAKFCKKREKKSKALLFLTYFAFAMGSWLKFCLGLCLITYLHPFILSLSHGNPCHPLMNLNKIVALLVQRSPERLSECSTFISYFGCTNSTLRQEKISPIAQMRNVKHKEKKQCVPDLEISLKVCR